MCRTNLSSRNTCGRGMGMLAATTGDAHGFVDVLSLSLLFIFIYIGRAHEAVMRYMFCQFMFVTWLTQTESKIKKHSLCVGWRNLVRVSLIFEIIVSFMFFMMYFISKNFWFTIHVDSWFWRIIDQICWACAILRSIPNLQACTNGRTDSQTN